MKCPHCSNEDKSLLERLKVLDYVHPVVYKYLCSCCSKTFLSEEDIYGPNVEVSRKGRPETLY